MPDNNISDKNSNSPVVSEFSQTYLANAISAASKVMSERENDETESMAKAHRWSNAKSNVPNRNIVGKCTARKNVSINCIVITGGPCAGKTTALNWIQNALPSMGYDVLFISESATELISGGVAPWTVYNNVEFQTCLLRLQREKESVFRYASAKLKRNKVLIVCDRGALDNKAYMTEKEFQKVINKLHTNEVELRDSYDAVFHLVTAAKGAEEYYSLANNTARRETADQAMLLDDKLVAAWTGHPHLRIIDNSTNFEKKMQQLISEISSFLGEPEPFEIERKFLIDYPNISLLESLPNCRKVDITQTYLSSSDPCDEVRIRQRGFDGNYTYSMTKKRTITGLKRIETEKRLTKDEYLALMMNADSAYRQIRKTRYCLVYNNQYFEIDIYPFWTEHAIVEVELRNEDEVVHFPEYLTMIREVTEEETYKNHSLAKIQ